MINDLFQKEVKIIQELKFHSEFHNCSYRWTVIVGKESYDLKTIADGFALGTPDYFILSAGEESPIFYFDNSLQKTDYIKYKGWELGPRLPKERNKGAKYYYILNPDGEINIVALTHWPLYLFNSFLQHIRSQY